jgi:hypothetical protein
VLAGVEPLTGTNRYAEGSATDKRVVGLIETRLLARVDQQRSTPTRAWLIETTIRPAFGDVAIAKIDSLIVERCYAELRHCRRLCK